MRPKGWPRSLTNKYADLVPLRGIAALQRLEAGEFVPLQVVPAVVTPLEPAHEDGALGQVNVVPA